MTKGTHLCVLGIFLSACLCLPFLSGCADSKQEFQKTVTSATNQLTPVVLALEDFKSRTGKYPRSLQELVFSGDLSEMPRCPYMGGNACELNYDADPLQSFFYLVVAFEFDTWGYRLHYVSFREEWKVTKYPPKMNDLILQSMGLRYRHEPSGSNLTLAINAMVSDHQGGGASRHVYRSLVTNALGPGVIIPLPPAIEGSERYGDRYDATNQEGHAFVVRYRKTTGRPMLITKEGALGNTDQVDEIYEVLWHNGNTDEVWTLRWKL